MYGDGSVYFSTAKQRWIYAFCDTSGKRRTKTFTTEKDAKAAMRKIRNNKPVYADKPTVGDWVLEFLNTYQKPKLRETSFKRQKQSAIKLTNIAHIPIDKLNGKDVQALYNSYRDVLSASSISKIHKLLFSAYKKAVALRMIDYNPMTAVDPIKTESKKIEIFTFLEIIHLFRVLRRNKYYKKYHDIFYVALTTGCRIGELLALKCDNIDLRNREIHVEFSKSNVSGQQLTTPKTKAGNRYIPIIHDKTLKILSQKQSGTFVFATSSGTAYSYQNLYKAWAKICSLAGINKNIHVFRHTFCTVALAKGIPLLEVSRIAGHADASTTLKMYGHAIPGYNQKIIKMFNKNFNTAT